MSVRMRDGVARFKVGDHVRMLGTGECGTVRSVLHFPRSIAYGVTRDDHGEQMEQDAGSFSEHELVPA